MDRRMLEGAPASICIECRETVAVSEEVDRDWSSLYRRAFCTCLQCPAQALDRIVGVVASCSVERHAHATAHDADDQQHDQDLDQGKAALVQGRVHDLLLPRADVGIETLAAALAVGAEAHHIHIAVDARV